MDNSKRQEEIKEILDQQQLLKHIREKVSKLLHKNIYVISGDQDIRETIKGYMETLGFYPEKIRTSNSTSGLINRIKQNFDNVDLVICHLRVLDSRVSTQTGIQLLNIVTDMLLTVGSGKTVPFIFAEKEFERKDIVIACRSGASQFLILPSNAISLGQKLVEVFEKPKDSAIAKEVSKLLLEGNKLQEQGLFEQAIVYYNMALKIGGENSEVLTEKGNALLKAGNPEDAIQSFIRATEFESNFPRAHQGLGMAYEQLGNFSKAKKNYRKVLEMEPYNVQVCYNIGVIYQEEGDFKEGKTYFEKGMGMNKKFLKNYLGLAKNYEIEDRPKKSLEVYKEALKYNPNQAFLYLTVGDFCLKHNLNKEAEDLFGEAISLNERHTHLYNRMGIALRKQGKYNEAIANFVQALKIKPDDANLRYNLAKSHYLGGQNDMAVDILNGAFDLDPYLKLKFAEDQFFSTLLEKYPNKIKI